MVTRCVARRDSRARHPEESWLGDPFESFISRLCFQVYCVRDTGGWGLEEDEPPSSSVLLWAMNGTLCSLQSIETLVVTVNGGDVSLSL